LVKEDTTQGRKRESNCKRGEGGEKKVKNEKQGTTAKPSRSEKGPKTKVYRSVEGGREGKSFKRTWKKRGEGKDTGLETREKNTLERLNKIDNKGEERELGGAGSRRLIEETESFQNGGARSRNQKLGA